MHYRIKGLKSAIEQAPALGLSKISCGYHLQTTVLNGTCSIRKLSWYPATPHGQISHMRGASVFWFRQRSPIPERLRACSSADPGCGTMVSPILGIKGFLGRHSKPAGSQKGTGMLLNRAPYAIASLGKPLTAPAKRQNAGSTRATIKIGFGSDRLMIVKDGIYSIHELP